MKKERKIKKIDKSYGITIPLDILKENGIAPEDMVQISSNNGEISIQKSRRVTLPKRISPDFFDILEETTKKHEETIKGLVER